MGDKRNGRLPNSSAQIFNRYGKLIITLTSSNHQWDGKYSNALLPADDYWYRLKLDDSTEITGHFTLKDTIKTSSFNFIYKVILLVLQNPYPKHQLSKRSVLFVILCNPNNHY
jgi:gliding motility-associated-like protein